MNVFRGSKQKMIISIIAAVAVVFVIIFFIFRGKGTEETPDDTNRVTDAPGGSFSEYGIGQQDKENDYPEGIVVLTDSDDYNIMLSDRGLLSSEGSLSSVGGSVNPIVENNLSDITAGEGTATILVYFIGSDLESEFGCATADIREMIASGVGKARNINLIIETGGAKSWKNNAVSASKLQRFRVLRDGLYLLEEEDAKSMVSPETLQDFISWGVENYPADTFGFIFWDHGGGSFAGIGGDELFEGELKLTDIDAAFTNAGAYFNFVGFDASLMATLETAYMLSKHADYMIASQETEPGGGWYYTDWLKILAKNPGIGIDILSKQLADDMVKYSGTCGQATSLSTIRIDRVSDVYTQLCSFLKNANDVLTGTDFSKVLQARYETGTFGDGRYELADIIDLAQKSGIEGADALAASVKEATVYLNSNLGYANGLSMYFPYDSLSYYPDMSGVMKALGMNDPRYFAFLDAFTGIMAGSDPARESALKIYADTKLQAVEKDENEYYAVTLTKEQLSDLRNSDASMYINDGEGYITLGCDDLCGVDADGDIMLDFDNTWITIEEHPVCLSVRKSGKYADGSGFTYGIIDAELTDENGNTKDIELIVQWDKIHEEGYVKGYRKAAATTQRSSANGQSTAGGPVQSQRALMQFSKGDRIRFVYDRYTYAGELQTRYQFGEEIIFDEELEVSYEEMDELNTDIRIHLTDIFNNEYESEPIK
ncbi:MAG: hypothetical protein J6Y89_04295 [Lachnospiraceae bacterium]|nr:hypothetical protein [Lachnospiraceae bacterium]